MAQTMISRLTLKQINIPFKLAFRHASAERMETCSLWVESVSDNGITGYGESCPRSYVTGETLTTASAFFLKHQAALCNEIDSLAALRFWLAEHSSDIDANPAAWCAIELAILDMLAKENTQTIEALLGLPPLEGRFQYTAVLGDADRQSFQILAEKQRRYGFRDFKLKLSGHLQRDQEKMAIIKEWGAEAGSIRADANNLWRTADDAIDYLNSLNYAFSAVEEPIQANLHNNLTRIAEALSCKIILDESFLRISQFELLHRMPQIWLINLRVSKMGGLLRSLAIIETARALGIGLIIGAQVGETSLLTRAGLTAALAALAAQDILVAQEGAFGTFLLEHDICTPSLMFGASGVLDCNSYPMLQTAGLGLVPTSIAEVTSSIS